MKKQLYRSRKNNMIAGVLGGVAEYFEIDTILIRVVVGAMIVTSPSLFVFYIVAAMVIPKEPKKPKVEPAPTPKTEYETYQDAVKAKERLHNSRYLLGGGFVLGGILLAMKNLNWDFYIPEYIRIYTIPALFVIGGLILIFGNRK